MICNHNIGIRTPMAVGVGVGVRVGVGLPPMPESTSGGGAKSIEQWMLMAEALGMTVISDSEIEAECEAQWANPSAQSHNAEDLATIQVELQGGAMEEFWDIPEQIDIQAVSASRIINELTAQWAAQTL